MISMMDMGIKYGNIFLNKSNLRIDFIFAMLLPLSCMYGVIGKKALEFFERHLSISFRAINSFFLPILTMIPVIESMGVWLKSTKIFEQSIV